MIEMTEQPQENTKLEPKTPFKAVLRSRTSQTDTPNDCRSTRYLMKNASAKDLGSLRSTPPPTAASPLAVDLTSRPACTLALQAGASISAPRVVKRLEQPGHARLPAEQMRAESARLADRFVPARAS